jgi:YVTN family beta-propeller protein
VCLSPDGKWLFAQVDPLIGFEAADLSKGKVVHRIASQVTAGKEKVRSRSHGIGVRPDGKELWGCDVDRQEVQVFDLTGERPRQVAAIPLGNRVYWLAFSPDGRTCYVSVHGHDEVAVIDTATKEVKARVKVGKGPKRLLVVTPAR